VKKTAAPGKSSQMRRWNRWKIWLLSILLWRATSKWC